VPAKERACGAAPAGMHTLNDTELCTHTRTDTYNAHYGLRPRACLVLKLAGSEAPPASTRPNLPSPHCAAVTPWLLGACLNACPAHTHGPTHRARPIMLGDVLHQLDDHAEHRPVALFAQL